MKKDPGKEMFDELRRRLPFDRMHAEDVRWLVMNFRRTRMDSGDVILEPGKPCLELFFIRSGVVQLEAMGDAEGSLKILAELVEGEIFPLEALEENRQVFSTFRAKTETVCYRLALHDFETLKSRSTLFADFCKYRAASFLEQSRRVFRLHFSHQSEEQQRLSAPLSILMCPDPLTVRPELPVREVLARMHARDADSVVIVDGDNRPTGLFTMRDLLRNIVIPMAG